MPLKQLTGTFEPLLAAAIAGASYYSSNGEIIKALSLAMIGGGLGWLGKTLTKSLFMYCKAKVLKNREAK